MGEESARDTPAAVGGRNLHLAIKSHRGEHMARGWKIVRKCISGKYPEASLEIHAPQLFCPVCSFREIARRRVGAGVGVLRAKEQPPAA